MKYYTLTGAFDYAKMKDVVNFFNENPNDEVTLYIDSEGGYTPVREILYDIIIKREPNVNVMFTNRAYSNAFILLFDLLCTDGFNELNVSECCNGMIHKGAVELYVQGDGKLQYPSHDKVILERTLRGDELFMQKPVWNCFTKSEQKAYKLNQDIYFDPKRLHRMIKQVVKQTTRVKR